MRTCSASLVLQGTHSEHRNNYLSNTILDTDDAKKSVETAQSRRMPGVRGKLLNPRGLGKAFEETTFGLRFNWWEVDNHTEKGLLYTILTSPFLSGGFKWSESLSRANSLQPHGLYSPWNSLGQNTGVGSLSLLQGIFPTQGLNSGLLHCKQILYQLSQKGSPRILEWVAYLFSKGSSQPRNWTGVSCIAGRFFTSWAIRKALIGGF